MNLYKFDPTEDITTSELATVLKTFLLIMHGEGPEKNLEVEGEFVDYLINQKPEFARHFQKVDGYD